MSPRRAPTRIISNGQPLSTRRFMALRATLSAQLAAQRQVPTQLATLSQTPRYSTSATSTQSTQAPRRAPMAELSYSNIIACPQPQEPLYIDAETLDPFRFDSR